MAANVETLNAKVPIHWVEALHHVRRAGSRLHIGSPGARDERSCSVAAVVKKIEPTKKVTATTVASRCS